MRVDFDREMSEAQIAWLRYCVNEKISWKPLSGNVRLWCKNWNHKQTRNRRLTQILLLVLILSVWYN